MKAVIADIKESIRLYFLPITNPKKAWAIYRDLFRPSAASDDRDTGSVT